MNRTHDKEFFTLWDLEQHLSSFEGQTLSAKEKLELQTLEAVFFDTAGYPPAYQGYQAAIDAYKNR